MSLKFHNQKYKTGGQDSKDSKLGLILDEKSTGDHIYYNMIITNSSTGTIQATQIDNSTFPILESQEDYYLSLIRLTVPLSNVPLFTFVNNTYSVTLVYSSTVVQTFLTYSSADNTGSLKTVSNFQQFIDMINTALSTAYTALGVLPTGTVAPYMIYDPSTQLFSLIQQIANVTDGVQVWFNEALANFFPLFYYKTTVPFGTGLNGRDFQVICEDTKNNTYLTSYYQMFEMGPSFWNFPSWNTILITSNIGTRPEWSSNLQNPGSPSFQQEITDLQPQISEAQDAQSILVYNPSGPYRLIDIVNRGPLKSIQATVSTVDKLTGIPTPITLLPGQVVTLKFMFRRKSLGI